MMNELRKSIGIAIVFLAVGFAIGTIVIGAKWRSNVDDRVDAMREQWCSQEQVRISEAYHDANDSLTICRYEAGENREKMDRLYYDIREVQIERDTYHRHWLECEDRLFISIEQKDEFRKLPQELEMCYLDRMSYSQDASYWEAEAEYWEGWYNECQDDD